MQAPTLHTERMTLRMPRIEDFEPYAAFFADKRAQYEVAKPLSREEAWAQFGRDVGLWALRGTGPWSMEAKDGTYIGEIGIFHQIFYPEAELGWGIVDDAFEGKGYASEGARAVMEYMRGQGFDELVSYIDPENQRSCALAERLGAVLSHTRDLPDNETSEACLVYVHDLRRLA